MSAFTTCAIPKSVNFCQMDGRLLRLVSARVTLTQPLPYLSMPKLYSKAEDKFAKAFGAQFEAVIERDENGS